MTRPSSSSPQLHSFLVDPFILDLTRFLFEMCLWNTLTSQVNSVTLRNFMLWPEKESWQNSLIHMSSLLFLLILYFHTICSILLFIPSFLLYCVWWLLQWSIHARPFLQSISNRTEGHWGCFQWHVPKRFRNWNYRIIPEKMETVISLHREILVSYLV